LTAWRRFRRTRKSATIKHLLQGGYLVNKLLPGSGVVHLHAHFAHSPTSVALFASQLSGLPFSFTAHAKDIYTSDPRQLREKLSRSRLAVTCTEYNRRHLQGLSGSGACPIHRIYHGIDLNLFSPPSAVGPALPPAEPYRLLTVARMTPKKGLKTVYQMVKILHERGVGLSHTLIGDGEQRDELRQMIDTMGLGSITRWRGTLPHEEVTKALAESDLFVLGCEVAANGDRDGIPNVIVESLAMGCPVVATGISALPEIVVNGETGLLVPSRRPDKMADAAMRLLTDTALRQEVIVRGRRHVEDHFDNRVLVRELGALLRREIPALALTPSCR
jgi:glycosyltransferase involved in cell wall biosynthesis